MEDRFQVGVITQTHGVRGEVKVFPLTDDISRFKNMKNLLLDGGKDGYISLEVENVRPQKNLVILKFKGIDNINDIEKYKGKGLYVTKDNRVELKKDEYFIADLIGCDVYTDEAPEEKLGVISDVMETGANDVYDIQLEKGGNVLIPAIKDCVLKVDIENRRVDIHLMKGLMD